MHTLTRSIELYLPLVRPVGGLLRRQNSKSYQAVSLNGTQKTRHVLIKDNSYRATDVISVLCYMVTQCDRIQMMLCSPSTALHKLMMHHALTSLMEEF